MNFSPVAISEAVKYARAVGGRLRFVRGRYGYLTIIAQTRSTTRKWLNVAGGSYDPTLLRFLKESLDSRSRTC